MPTIRIQTKDLPYDESDVITFDEGLVGLPQLRRMVVITQPEISPFLWLASVEDPEKAFLVMEPRTQFDHYAPAIPAQVCGRIGLKDDEEPLLLAIVRILPEWQSSTVNLRAPLIVSPGAMRGVQAVLTDSPYRVDESLAGMAAAA
jgi:flagellar assembly factor FliW